MSIERSISMSTIMGMGIGTNTERPDHGYLIGTQVPIACSVWFTSTGRMIPRLIKYQDKDNEVHILKDFQILYQEEKYYCGIPMVEYECTLENDVQKVDFHLLYYVEQKEWKLWWKYRKEN